MPDFVWIQEVVFPILGMAMATFFGWQILRIVNGQLERKSGRHWKGEIEGLRDEVEQLRLSVESSTDTGRHLADLEERLEFAERILARRRHGEIEAGRE